MLVPECPTRLATALAILITSSVDRAEGGDIGVVELSDILGWTDEGPISIITHNKMEHSNKVKQSLLVVKELQYNPTFRLGYVHMHCCLAE